MESVLRKPRKEANAFSRFNDGGASGLMWDDKVSCWYQYQRGYRANLCMVFRHSGAVVLFSVSCNSTWYFLICILVQAAFIPNIMQVRKNPALVTSG